MSSQPATPTMNRRPASNVRWIALAAGVLVVLGAMVLDTKVVTIGSDEDVRKAVFSAGDVRQV